MAPKKDKEDIKEEEEKFRSGPKISFSDLEKSMITFTGDDTTARIKKAQDQDIQIDIIKRILEREPYEDYLLENGVLTKHKDGRKLIVVLKKMQYEIITIVDGFTKFTRIYPVKTND